MKVSIIITNYNYAQYVEKCINSCLQQKFDRKSFEIIFVDDASTDKSRFVAKKFLKYKNFSTIFNKKNLGVAQSANKAILKSKGKFFIRVDSDDYVKKNYIKILYNQIVKEPKILAVSCNYFYYYDKKNTLKKVKYSKKPISCAVMYNKNKFLNFGLYNKNFRHREEEEFRKRVGYDCVIKNNKNYLYFYRIHNNNKTKNKKEMSSFKKKINNLYN